MICYESCFWDYSRVLHDQSSRIGLWHVLCNVLLKSLSSASDNSSATDGSSSSQRPSRLHRFMNECSLARSAAVHIQDQAGTPYVTLATTVAQKTSCSAVANNPLLRRTRKTYSRLEQDDIKLFTCSVAVRRSLTMMPRIRKLVTLSMLRHWEGSWTEVARVELAVIISSLDLTQFSSRLTVTFYHSMP